MRVFLLEKSYENKKCPGCNWETTNFYGLGETKEKVLSNYLAGDKYGQGLCSECLVDIFLKRNLKIKEVSL
jgi:hypothetical protein